MKMRMLCAPLGVLALIAATTAAAAPPADVRVSVSDARWSAWLGCWRPETVDGLTPPSHVICVLPGSDEGVTIATIADGKIVSEQIIVADGSRRNVDEGGCKGFEAASWSQDGRRVFLKSELNCGGDVQRRSNGVLALVSTASYVDIQTVDISGQKASRTVRYIALRDTETPSIARDRLKSEPMARESARIRASAPLDFDDIVEATRMAGTPAADGLLVARRAGFGLNADRLRSLAAAGVAPSTIDVMVALTYPDHFEVAEEAPRVASDRTPWGGGVGRGETWSGTSRNSCLSRVGDRVPAYDSYGFDSYGYGYSRCGYNSYYSPYGYDRYGWGYGTGPVVVLQPSEKPDPVQGAAIKGRGYTRRGTSDGSTVVTKAKPRAEPTTTRTTEGTAAVKGNGGSASGSAASGSGSSTSTGRTAKPKGGGS
ncbi:MAG: hypothetical protein ABIV28_02540 [Longimicrobiales bacterium]